MPATTTTTIVQNKSGIRKIFSFLPPYGATLDPDETFEYLGDIISALQGNRRDFEAYQRALADGNLLLLQTPGSPGWGVPVQDLTELRAIPPEERFDKQVRLVEDEGSEYRFDAQGTDPDNGSTIIAPDTGTGRWYQVEGGGLNIVEQEFMPTPSQTVFTLLETWAGNFALLTVNGIEYDRGADYTVAGTTLTWLDNEFTLDAGDKLIFKYDKE